MYFGPRINRLMPNLAEHGNAAMTFAPSGGSGNPRGPYAPSRERARFSSEFISALLRDFRQGGPAAIAKVRKYQPAAYMKICALLVPREMKVEHSGGVKAMSDDEIEQAIESIERFLAERAEKAKVIEGTAETVALSAPDVVPDRPNKVMDAADTAVVARKRKPGKGRVPSPAGT
jgi:hypothetical protein